MMNEEPVTNEVVSFSTSDCFVMKYATHTNTKDSVSCGLATSFVPEIANCRVCGSWPVSGKIEYLHAGSSADFIVRMC